MFKFHRGKVLASFSEDEADLLRKLISDYKDLIAIGPSAGDAVLQRLFPTASPTDEKVEMEYRELASEELKSHKHVTTATALDVLGRSGGWEGEVSEEQRESWLMLLTDLRLSLGVRLGMTEEMMAAPVDPNDPEQWPTAVLHYLGAIQESLVESTSKAMKF